MNKENDKKWNVLPLILLGKCSNIDPDSQASI